MARTDQPEHLAAAFPPLRFTALRRALAVQPDDYARHHGALEGAACGLSPYLTHGILNAAELFGIWQQRLGLTLADKLCQDLAWRSFHQHTWRHLGDGIFDDIRPRTWLPPGQHIPYTEQLPADIRMAATGVPVIDASVRQLYATGHLHRQQRLWLASYIVHLRKVDWRAGAGWMLGHLLDGDPASNHLSWQWVAGCFSDKPWLFNADSVARSAPQLASTGTAIDRSHEELEALALSPQAAEAEALRPLPMREPALLAHPPWSANPPLPGSLRGHEVQLVHPWMLSATTTDALRVGLIHLPHHASFPWSAQRWSFVHARMQQCCDFIWVGDLRHAQAWLAEAHSVSSVWTPHAIYREALELAGVRLLDAPAPWAEPTLPCASFQSYLTAITRLTPALMQTTMRGQVRRLRDANQRSPGG
ncbi:MAG: FAD-binding domain-containing protein [Moraxellaceae bacterium]|nr:FAD-binding domain-containing protein [Moraxellaceae bacterium]